MRLRVIFLASAICWCLIVNVGPARGQSVPFAPFSPTDPKLCANYAAEVERYNNEITAEHERCLHAGKEDRPNLPPDSPLCSRNACQYLHDELFSDYSSISVKVLRKKVDACYAQVNEYQDRQAAQKREAEQREQAARDQESAEKTRKKRDEDGSQPAQTRISPTPASQSPANNGAVLPPNQQTGQPYSVGGMKVPDTPQTEQSRQAAKDREQKDLSEQALNEMADPFGKSGKSASANKSTTAPDGVVDPFGSSRDDTAPNNSSSDAQLADPFAANSSSKLLEAESDKELAVDKTKEIAFDKTKELIEEKSEAAIKKLNEYIDEARSKLSPSDFKAYQADVQEAEAYLRGLGRVLEAAPFIKDAWVASNDFQKGWNDFMHDCESKGFEYVLKRLSPPLSKIYQGPVGWALSITFDSSSTQTPAQDFDPMSVINNPSRYSFDQRVSALEQIIVSQDRHPEVWNDSKRQWLYNLTLQVYNSPDNPNIHLTPQ